MKTQQQTIPVLGFGVYALDPATTRRAVEDALATGFRHVDTAQSYANESDVGAALAAFGLPRDDVFVTTKITPRNFAPGALVPSVEASREALGVDYIDLTLIHYPSPWDEIPMEVYLEQLAEAQARGMTRQVGVSNFTIAQMIRAEEILGAGNVATNQVEIHVYHQNPKVVAHCRARAIPATAYCALARGMVFGIPEARLGPHRTLLDLADKHGATVSQICLAFLIAEGHVTLSTTIDPEQMRDNLAARNVALDASDMAALRGMDRGKRIVEMPYFPDFD
ncbi:MAG: aldo/keto reductase [Rhodobacteraceae bacterium]|nr:aldo/keto reductase [Paracoccaceae bacterium]